MKIIYFYELDSISENILNSIFKTETDQIINLFLKEGICRKYENSFFLEYVGIIAYSETIIAVLPKFLKKFDFSHEEKSEILKLIIEVIKKYKNDTIFNTEQSENIGGNIFALIDYFFKDYISNGLYKTFIEKLEYNGEGEINWEETIENEDSHFINNSPIYLNFFTEETENDDKDLIKKIHKYILYSCKNYLLTSEVQKTLNLIEIPYFDFFINEYIGDKDYIITQIDNRLNLEFNEQKIILLKKMKIFINEIYSKSNNGLELWGVNKFWTVWEKCCKNIFKDEKEHYKKIIKPVWSNLQEDNKEEKDTLIPDILREEEGVFYILDAKYYDFYFNDNGKMIGSPPEISSIIKQYAYELAFKKYFKNIKNYFIIPAVENTKVIGKVNFDIFDLQPIKVLQLDYKTCFYMYLKNLCYNEKEMKNIIL